MHILVTGGCGFIGSHSVRALLAANLRVRILDNFSSGRPSNVPAHPGLEIMEGDIRERNDVVQAMHDITHVLHLAAQISTQASIADPAGSCNINIVGFLNVLDAAVRFGVSRLVYASSAAVYGDSASPADESQPCAPRSPYGLEKLVNDEYAALYRRLHNLSCLGLRYFNVYGPGQAADSPYSGVISKFLHAAANEQMLTIYGDGAQTRDFVYVGDIAEVNRRALLSRSTGVCNVGTGVSCSLRELIATISIAHGIQPWVRQEAARPGDILHSGTRVDQLRRALGFVPRTDLLSGVRKISAWPNSGSIGSGSTSPL